MESEEDDLFFIVIAGVITLIALPWTFFLLKKIIFPPSHSQASKEPTLQCPCSNCIKVKSNWQNLTKSSRFSFSIIFQVSFKVSIHV